MTGPLIFMLIFIHVLVVSFSSGVIPVKNLVEHCGIIVLQNRIRSSTLIPENIVRVMLIYLIFSPSVKVMDFDF